MDIMSLAPDTRTTIHDLAQRRGLPARFLAEYVRVAGPGEEQPGWYAFDYPHLTGIWKTRYMNPTPGALPKYLDQSGSGSRFYNPLLLGPQTEELWICEGEIDTLTLAFLGLPAIGVPGVGHGEKMVKTWVYLFDGARVSVVFDGDSAGRAAAGKVAESFVGAKVVNMPDGMDVNDLWLRGPDELRDLLGLGTDR